MNTARLWPALVAGLFFLCTTAWAQHDHVPRTVSEPAREFLRTATPADLGQPATESEWRALREAIEQAYRNQEIIQERYSFKAMEQSFGGVDTLVYSPEHRSSQQRLLLYLHGGAYVVGSPEIGASIIVPVSHHAELTTVAVRFRLAPEHPFPASLEDALSVYRALLAAHPGVAVAIYGSSSGGALAVALTLRIAEENLPLPAAVGLLSPWSDLTKTGDNYYTLEGIAPLLDYELTLEYAAGLYAGTHDLREPLLSPVYAEFPAGFPPSLIQVGTRDLFLSNGARLQRRMLDAGVPASLSLWEGMWHSFQLQPQLPEAENALREMAAFLTAD